jgi:hypothetical protein
MLDGTMSYNNQQFSGFAGMMEFIRGNLWIYLLKTAF